MSGLIDEAPIVALGARIRGTDVQDGRTEAAVAQQVAALRDEGAIHIEISCPIRQAATGDEIEALVGAAVRGARTNAGESTVGVVLSDAGAPALLTWLTDGVADRVVGVSTSDAAVAATARAGGLFVRSNSLPADLIDRVGAGFPVLDHCEVSDGRIAALDEIAAAIRDGGIPVEVAIDDDDDLGRARLLFDAGFRLVLCPVEGSARRPLNVAAAEFGASESAALVERMAVAAFADDTTRERLVAGLGTAWEARPARLLHLAERDRWEAARQQAAYLPGEWDRDGFIHLSAVHQLLTPANRFYRGRDDLVALVVDAHHLGSAVVWEAGTGTVERFPHLYSALPEDAVLREVPITPEPDGGFLLPPALVRAARSPLGR